MQYNILVLVHRSAMKISIFNLLRKTLFSQWYTFSLSKNNWMNRLALVTWKVLFSWWKRDIHFPVFGFLIPSHVHYEMNGHTIETIGCFYRLLIFFLLFVTINTKYTTYVSLSENLWYIIRTTNQAFPSLAIFQRVCLSINLPQIESYSLLRPVDFYD